MACEHKTEEEYGVCNRCTTYRNIAWRAKEMLDARKKYMDQLLADPKLADTAQFDLGDAVRRLEREVNLATMANLFS